jgi:hypothetical protein
MAGRLATDRAPWILAATIILVDGCPGPALGFLPRNSTLLVAFGDMIRLALLPVSRFRFVATWHGEHSCEFGLNEKAVLEFHAGVMVLAIMPWSSSRLRCLGTHCDGWLRRYVPSISGILKFYVEKLALLRPIGRAEPRS